MKFKFSDSTHAKLQSQFSNPDFSSPCRKHQTISLRLVYMVKSIQVSCIIPARNEAGRLERTVLDALSTGLVDEIVIVEGGSTDDTWRQAVEIQNQLGDVRSIRQTGFGKFNAVRNGFEITTGKYIVIWDADGTVRSNDTKKLIETAVAMERTTIGNRLLGKRHPKSMRFANLLGNCAFAILWQPLLNWKFMDLLCGSKVFAREDFEKIPSWVLDRDPFGDFSLVASAIVRNSHPISVPVEYFPRDYGETNIKRWRSGVKLLVTTTFCFLWIFRVKLKHF